MRHYRNRVDRSLYTATHGGNLGDQDHLVSGYPGGAEIDLAIERNEVVCWSPLITTLLRQETSLRRWRKSGIYPRGAAVRLEARSSVERRPDSN